MRKLIAFVAALAAFAPQTLARQARPEPPAAVTAIRCARYVDVARGAYVENATILVRGERIAEVGANVAVPAGARVVDLRSATVLPGLVDAHTHLLWNADSAFGGDNPNLIMAIARMGTTRRALMGAAMAREALDAGITTVRDLGNSGVNGDVALRDAINAGWVPGPRVCASTRAISPVGGQFTRLAPEARDLVAQEYAEVTGVDEARRAVRRALFDGADCVKVIVDADPRSLSREEVSAIVDEAHRAGRKVAAHATGPAAIDVAIDAGVDSIEHGYGATEAQLVRMAEKGVFLVPTDGPVESYLTLYASARATPEQTKEFEAGVRAFVDASRKRLARAVALGVPVAAGSDWYYDVPGSTRGRASLATVRAYRDAGLRPAQILRAATIDGARLLGWEDRVGSVEKGKYADLIAVAGDPLADATELERAVFVMKNGVVVRGPGAP